MEDYQIKRFKRIRMNKTQYIILVPSTLLREDFYIDPIVLDSGRVYTYGIWEKYFLLSLRKPALPMHYFMERIDEDYVAIKGLAEYHPSYFLEDLVSASIIDYKYMHSIIVVIGENFNRYNLDKRLAEQLAYKILCPLMRRYKLHQESIKFFDECLTEDWKENLKYSNLEYKLEESKYFDINVLMQFINKHKNF